MAWKYWLMAKEDKARKIEAKAIRQAKGAPLIRVKANAQSTRDLLIQHGWTVDITVASGIAPIIQYMMIKPNPERVKTVSRYNRRAALYRHGQGPQDGF